MRIILLGMELINISTAKYLAEKGYDVSIVEERTHREVTELFLSVYFEDQIFIKNMDKQLRELGVNLRYGCKAKKFMTEGKIVRALSIINECKESELLSADRFIAAFDYKTRSVFKTLNITSTTQFKSLYHIHCNNKLIGKSHYSNLLLSTGQVTMGITAINQLAKILVDIICNPLPLYTQKVFSKNYPIHLFSNVKKTVQRFLTYYLLIP